MKEIEFYAGDTIDHAWRELLRQSADCGETCFGMFNGRQLLSTDTLDEAYKKVTGLTKSELDEQEKNARSISVGKRNSLPPYRPRQKNIRRPQEA